MTIEEIRDLINEAEYGYKYYLIGGNSMEYGYDEDEIIIKNAEVIAVL